MCRPTDRNLREILTQIFDRFMDVGIHVPIPPSPIYSMLVAGDSATQDLEVLGIAFQDLYHGLRACLCGLGFHDVMRVDDGQFNYKFTDLRGGDVVITYLSNEHGNYR